MHIKSITQQKLVLFLFSHLLICKNFTIFYDVTPLALIIHLYFSKCFAPFKFASPSQNSDMNNRIRIIFTKIIIKINFFKIYSKNMFLISNKCDFITIFIIKEYIIISMKVLSNFPSILLVTNQSVINFNAARQSSTASLHSF